MLGACQIHLSSISCEQSNFCESFYRLIVTYALSTFLGKRTDSLFKDLAMLLSSINSPKWPKLGCYE